MEIIKQPIVIRKMQNKLKHSKIKKLKKKILNKKMKIKFKKENYHKNQKLKRNNKIKKHRLHQRQIHADPLLAIALHLNKTHIVYLKMQKQILNLKKIYKCLQ